MLPWDEWLREGPSTSPDEIVNDVLNRYKGQERAEVLRALLIIGAHCLTARLQTSPSGSSLRQAQLSVLQDTSSENLSEFIHPAWWGDASRLPPSSLGTCGGPILPNQHCPSSPTLHQTSIVSRCAQQNVLLPSACAPKLPAAAPEVSTCGAMALPRNVDVPVPSEPVVNKHVDGEPDELGSSWPTFGPSKTRTGVRIQSKLKARLQQEGCKAHDQWAALTAARHTAINIGSQVNNTDSCVEHVKVDQEALLAQSKLLREVDTALQSPWSSYFLQDSEAHVDTRDFQGTSPLESGHLIGHVTEQNSGTYGWESSFQPSPASNRMQFMGNLEMHAPFSLAGLTNYRAELIRGQEHYYEGGMFAGGLLDKGQGHSAGGPSTVWDTRRLLPEPLHSQTGAMSVPPHRATVRASLEVRTTNATAHVPVGYYVGHQGLALSHSSQCTFSSDSRHWSDEIHRVIQSVPGEACSRATGKEPVLTVRPTLIGDESVHVKAYSDGAVGENVLRKQQAAKWVGDFGHL